MEQSYIIENFKRQNSEDPSTCEIYQDQTITHIGESHHKRTINPESQALFEDVMDKADIVVVERSLNQMMIKYEEESRNINSKSSYMDQAGKISESKTLPLISLDDSIRGVPDYEKVGMSEGEYWFIQGMKRGLISVYDKNTTPLETLPDYAKDAAQMAAYIADYNNINKLPEGMREKFFELFSYSVYLETPVRDLQYYHLLKEIQNANPDKHIVAVTGRLHAQNLTRMAQNNGEPYQLSSEEIKYFYDLKDTLYQSIHENGFDYKS